jgi:hypothetical protein
VYLAGLRIRDEDVRELIRLVDEPTRSFLARSLAFEAEVVALTIEDREPILWALEDVRTDALAELRGVCAAAGARVAVTRGAVVAPLRFAKPLLGNVQRRCDCGAEDRRRGHLVWALA